MSFVWNHPQQIGAAGRIIQNVHKLVAHYYVGFLSLIWGTNKKTKKKRNSFGSGQRP